MSVSLSLGIAGVVCGFPLDTVVIRLQTQTLGGPVYKNALHCFTSIVRTESLLGLYKGVAIPLTTSVVTEAILVSLYGTTLRLIGGPEESVLNIHSANVSLKAGALTGLAFSVVDTPLDFVTTQLRMQSKGIRRLDEARRLFTGPFLFLHQLYQEKGLISSLYKGSVATLFRNVIGYSLYFFGWDFFRYLLLPASGNREDLGFVRITLAGALSGCISVCSSYPFDVIQSRIQGDQNRSNPVYRSTMDCIRRTYKEAGLKGFFPGLTLALLVYGSASGIAMLVVSAYLSYVRGEYDNH